MKRLKTHEIIDDPDLLAEAFCHAAKRASKDYYRRSERRWIEGVTNADWDTADAWYCIRLQVKDTIE